MPGYIRTKSIAKTGEETEKKRKKKKKTKYQGKSGNPDNSVNYWKTAMEKK
jgi:hypothetical protein